jgi:hypothetical protein
VTRRASRPEIAAAAVEPSVLLLLMKRVGRGLRLSGGIVSA